MTDKHELSFATAQISWSQPLLRMSRSEQVGFLQMMRWMLDSNFAGINTNAQKVHREVRGRTVRRAPHGSGR